MLQPHSQGHRSYFEAFKRRSNSTTAAASSVDVLNKNDILTDRGAYLSFLEVQLERVSRACVATQEFSHRIDVFAAKAAAAEEKVTSATKLIRLAQTYSEEQGRDQATINDALEERLSILEQQVDAAFAASNGGVDIHKRSPVSPASLSPASPGLCGINTAGLSEWMTGVDKQLQDLHELISAGISAKSRQQQKQQQADAAIQVKDTAAEAAQQAAQDEHARMEERVRRLEETLANAVDKIAAPNGSSNAEGSATATEISSGRSPSPTPTRNPSPPPPPPPPPRPSFRQEVVGEVGNETKLLDAVKEGTSVARRASELAQEALQAGKEAFARSERTESLAKALACRSVELASEQHGQLTEALDRLHAKITRSTDGGAQSLRHVSPGRDCGPGEDGSDAARSASPSPRPTAGSAGGCLRRGFGDRDGGTAGSLPSKRFGGAAGGGMAKPVARIRGRPGQAPRGGADEEGRVSATSLRSPRTASPRRATGRARTTAAAATSAARDAGGGTAGKKRRSVREIREILEKSSFADSDNGRRLALGAARNALESILREASPGPPPDRSGGCAAAFTAAAGRGVEARLGEELAGGTGVQEIRSVGELREAIRGAVNILAGIGGTSPIPEGEEEDGRPRRHSRRPQRGRRPESPLSPSSRARAGSRSQDRATFTPPRRGRDLKRHPEGHWVPPGNIPCKVGEQRRAGGPGKVRAPWEIPDEEEGKGEEGAT
eukprot:g6794.t1